MKRIQLQGLFFILATFILSSCTTLKLGKNQLKKTYLTLDKIKFMHYHNGHIEHQNSIKEIDSEDIFKLQNLENSGSVFDKLMNEDGGMFSKSNLHLNHFNSNEVGCELECCDLTDCDTDSPMCAVYLVHSSFGYVTSHEPIVECTIWNIKNNVVVASIQQPPNPMSFGDINVYEINLNTLIIGERYSLKVKVIDSSLEIIEYNVFIARY